MTNQKIVDLYQGLMSISSLTGVKFAYAVARNVDILKREIDSLRKANVPSEDYMKFEEARAKLAESHAVKVDGTPQKKFEDGMERFVIRDQAKFEKEFEELRVTHKSAVVARKKQLKEFDELLENEVEVDLFTIPFSYIPESISAKQMVDILLIVKEKE